MRIKSGDRGNTKPPLALQWLLPRSEQIDIKNSGSINKSMQTTPKEWRILCKLPASMKTSSWLFGILPRSQFEATLQIPPAELFQWTSSPDVTVNAIQITMTPRPKATPPAIVVTLKMQNRYKWTINIVSTLHKKSDSCILCGFAVHSKRRDRGKKRTRQFLWI